MMDIASFLGWNWEGLSFDLPASILLEIKATPVPFSNHSEDWLSWFSSPNGEFKLKEAYRLANLAGNNTANQIFRGDWVWKVQSLPKIKHFLWQCFHHSIPVQAILARRGMDVPFLCPICNNAPETIIHTLRDCPMAQRYWNSFSPPIQRSFFYDTNVMEWLMLNYQSSKSSSSSSMERGILFPFALWTIWLHRNNTVFGRPQLQKDSKAEVVAKAAEFLHLGINGKQIRAKTKIQVRWHQPPLS